MTALSAIVAVSVRDGTPLHHVWSAVPGANGHAIRADGTHVIMSSTGAIVELDESGRITRVPATHAAGKPLTYPNDVTLDPVRGGYYVTDSGYKTMPNDAGEEPQGRVIRVARNHTVSVAADGIAYANGIALAPDGNTLYVGESLTKTIWSYPVDAAGALGPRARFATLPSGARHVPDGITAASDGSLYVAHYGAGEVLVYARDGTLARRCPAGNRAASHVALDERHGYAYVSGGIEDESGAGAIFRFAL
jgi:gluconolactonase